MELQEKIKKRELLKDQIRIKADKIRKICQILTRNRFECQNMIRDHNKLDREIYEETIGIRRVAFGRGAKQIRAANKAALTDAFVQSLSKTEADKLIKRLQERLYEETIKKINKGLTETAFQK